MHIPIETSAVVQGYPSLRITAQRAAVASARSFYALAGQHTCVVAALRPAGPYPILVLHGEMGAGKSVMERSIAKANPDDLGAWRDARRQYRNMMILEQAAASAGENAALGLISPRALRQAAAMGRQGRRGYVRGQGDFADLARAGNALMLPMPQSGSAPRVLMSSGGALLGSALAGEPFSLAALAGIAAPGAFGRALMSRPVQRYLSSGRNTGALNGGLPARQNALLQALLAPSRIAPQSP